MTVSTTIATSGPPNSTTSPSEIEANDYSIPATMAWVTEVLLRYRIFNRIYHNGP